MNIIPKFKAYFWYNAHVVQSVIAKNEGGELMKTMTIRNIPDAVSGGVRQSAHRNRTSINAAAIALLSERLGLNHPEKKRDLSAFCGGWTRQEASAFDVATVRVIDREAWK